MIDGAALDWDDVRLFVVAARSGTLAGAAAELRLSPATAGRRLRRLEQAVGGRLFERRIDGLTATALGGELLAAAAAMEEGAAAFARRADALGRNRGAAAGFPVRITATTSVGMFLAGHLAGLLADTAGSGAVPAILPTRRPLSLARREADIALRMRRMPEDGALAVRRLGVIAFAVYAASGTWAGWPGATVVGLPGTDRAASQSGWLDAAALARGAVVGVRLGEVGLRHRAARDGIGPTLLPCFLGDADPVLVRVLEPPSALTEDVYLLIHEDLRWVPPIRRSADAVAALFRREAAALAGDVHA